ncbi:MAG: hypothetical protein Q4G39_04845 [Brachymonas sp.]|nr:hypothetical protein [Brachymonas sp.]
MAHPRIALVSLAAAGAAALAGCVTMPEQQPIIVYQPAPQPAPVAPAPRPLSPVEQYQLDEAEMASRTHWISYTSNAGEELRVRYFEMDTAGIPGDMQFYADAQLNGGRIMRFSKVAEQNGNPVYADTGNTGMVIVSRGGGGTVELTRGTSRTLFR